MFLEGLLNKKPLEDFSCKVCYEVRNEDLQEVIKVDDRYRAVVHSLNYLYAKTEEEKRGVFTVLNVTPMGAPRANQGKSWFVRGKKYMQFKDKLREEIDRVGFEVKTGYLDLIFCMPIPSVERGSKRSIREKISRLGHPHRQKPDIDNLVKGFMDTILKEDGLIYRVNAVKVWTTEPGIIICLK